MSTDYTITVRPTPGTDGVQAILGLLKVAGRRFGLRCVAVKAGGDAARPVTAVSIQRHNGNAVAVVSELDELVGGASLKLWTLELGAVAMTEHERGVYAAPDRTDGLLEVFGLTADGRGVHGSHGGRGSGK